MRCYTIVKRVTSHCCTITYSRKIKRGVEKCAEENIGSGMKQEKVRKNCTVKSYIIYIPQHGPVIELTHQENETEGHVRNILSNYYTTKIKWTGHVCNILSTVDIKINTVAARKPK